MRSRKTVVGIFGMLQSFIALTLIIFTCILYFNFFDVQTFLNIATSYLYLYLTVTIAYGFISLISGVFLLLEWWEKR